MKWVLTSIRITRMLGRVSITFLCITCALFYGVPSSQLALSSTDHEASSNTRTIIFDLGGILFATSSLKSFWILGPKALAQYWYYTRKPLLELKKTFYATLNKITDTTGNIHSAKDYAGDELPELMRQWLDGTQSASAIRNLVLNHIQQHPTWFIHKIEQLLMSRMARMIFTPALFVDTITPIKEGIALARAYKKQGHRLVILSNWDAESFTHLKQKYPQIFDLFDDVIVSGHTHTLKPHPSIFARITSLYNPDTCVFIDDQYENIMAAREVGIHAIQCPHTKTRLFSEPNFAFVRYKLAQWEKTQVTKDTYAESVTA